jgi:hypothetical protein
MSLFLIDDKFTNQRKSSIYYTKYNKIYYKSKYAKNFITKPVPLFDGIHDSSSYGNDLSSNKRIFINNKINGTIYYG